MKKFMDDDFMIRSDFGKRLYHEYAEKMPILDFHCHLSPKEIFEDKKFKNITEVWLGGDHYKWRAMRLNGVDEINITGDADDYTKFMYWAKTVPKLIGNPLYHWTHLELKRFFDIDLILNEENAPKIWETTNSMLAKKDFSARSLIERSNVYAVCTTDDPIDSLEYHAKIREEGTMKTKVLPAFRPDNLLRCKSSGYLSYIKKLSDSSGIEIVDLDSLKRAIRNRIDFFDANGCKASDHAFEYVPYVMDEESKVEEIFSDILNGETISKDNADSYVTHLMIFLAKEYKKREWIMEMHVGAIRDNNKRMFNKLGADTGFDAVNDECYAKSLAMLLNEMELKDGLPKTILFTLNPKDNIILNTLSGCFYGSDYGISKVQVGTAWWFLDHKEGMIKNIKDLASTGVLSNFVGMLTDSRSFLSYPRHEYFRRILCDIIGDMVDNGEYPSDEKELGRIVESISFDNIKKYINI